ncbi:MAG: ferritin-like domain-containing protein, partial [Chloroflexi bacterium]|nr:ferritin-like domain-containing protein [Chloroflexota bacterium]
MNIPEILEAAMAQPCTLLQETATVAMGFPSRWIYLINQEFLELKSYLSAQILDYARHVDVFRKRALAGGQGLKRASVAAEQALKELLSAETY